LLKCFEDNRTTTSRIIVEHFIKLNRSVSTQRIIMNLVPRILAHEDDFEFFAEFFIALKPGCVDSKTESTCMTFAQHQKAFELPKFSDEAFNMTEFMTGDLMRSDLRPFIIDSTLKLFQSKDP